ncbi:hypothetical protein [Anaerocellum danielii]|uniref:Uncharacterized protein n=1 Tax=Anaerocellum danielii TaxID=1387557 RepID=A0ABZ0U342_9FIRM|nr:hypothetical protein [Caldicellulosiruptor danielii]WPX09877.1 hypothetical protein SOJ16_001129 [Caldicellulosiruptor danielii]
MKKYSILVLVVLLNMCLLYTPAFAYRISSSTINHDEEKMRSQRQVSAEYTLNIIYDVVNSKDSNPFKKELEKLTGKKGPYDRIMFRLSEEYELYRPFVFPYKKIWTERGTSIYFEEKVKNKIKSFRIETFQDLINNQFVDKKWLRIIYYEDKPVGYMQIDWYDDKSNYDSSEWSIGNYHLFKAIENMKDFLKDKRENTYIKILSFDGLAKYIVSEDGKWWCTDGEGTINPAKYKNMIWSFEEIKDTLNYRPKEMLNYFETYKYVSEMPLGGLPFKPLYESVFEPRNKVKNMLVAIILLLASAITVAGIKFGSRIRN